MKIEEKIKIINDELKRFKVTKAACDSCIPQELIDCHEELIEDLRELEECKKVIAILKDKFEIEFNDYLDYASEEDLEENPNVYVMTIDSKDINCNEFTTTAMTSLNEIESKIMEKMFNE